MGNSDFETIITRNNFYVDKTNFIKEWWENEDVVTLITRPRRFGKTLTMNMVERFFSVKYMGKGELFSGLDIWGNQKFRGLQGTVPVISLSFSGIKCDTYKDTIIQIRQAIADLYLSHPELRNSGILQEPEVEYFDGISRNLPEMNLVVSLRKLCGYVRGYYNRKVIVLLDEFDTPLQAAYVHGYWKELISFVRGLFEATFKTNPHLDRALLTGITRVSKESLFSGLNNLIVVSTTSSLYADSFGFTQEEVSAALKEFGLDEQEGKVQFWYNGFTFGDRTDIYNPWSITNFLKLRKFQCFWADTSDNALVNELIRRGGRGIKIAMGHLLEGETVRVESDDHIDFSLLVDDTTISNEAAVWNLLLASGYLKVEHRSQEQEIDCEGYDLKITNEEVKRMFRSMIRGWFPSSSGYNDFLKALLEGNTKEMNLYMNDVALKTFSNFDSGKKPSEKAEPERFYHGFVLGLMVDLANRYVVTSNRESGYGRYDVMLKPKENGLPAIIIEFKVHNPQDEGGLKETVVSALKQICDNKYATTLITEGFHEENIRAYGFAFEGKKVLIDGGAISEVEGILGRV
ncbi:MAG: ATP-binding protein [Lachnospiraceae bacterium]|nr:ATP-binding protein [Lachnospiraceae bacterium]